MLASLYEPNTSSRTTVTAEALLAPRASRPPNSSGCPKASALFPQTYVVVPMPPEVTSP